MKTREVAIAQVWKINCPLLVFLLIKKEALLLIVNIFIELAKEEIRGNWTNKILVM